MGWDWVGGWVGKTPTPDADLACLGGDKDDRATALLLHVREDGTGGVDGA